MSRVQVLPVTAKEERVTRLTSPCHILDKPLANVLRQDYLMPDAAPAVVGMAAAVQKQAGSASRAAFGSRARFRGGLP